jgi:hypothetical protein
MFPKALNQHQQNDSSRSTIAKDRCQYLTRFGRQCRTQIAPAHDTLCPRHAAPRRRRHPALRPVADCAAPCVRMVDAAATLR